MIATNMLVGDIEYQYQPKEYPVQPQRPDDGRRDVAAHLVAAQPGITIKHIRSYYSESNIISYNVTL